MACGYPSHDHEKRNEADPGQSFLHVSAFWRIDWSGPERYPFRACRVLFLS